VIAADRKIVALRVWIRAALDLTDTPPKNVGRVAILFVAGHHATFAPDAFGHVEVKPVLLAGTGQRQFMTRRCCAAEHSHASGIDCIWRIEFGPGFLHSFDEWKFHSSSDSADAPVSEESHYERMDERGSCRALPIRGDVVALQGAAAMIARPALGAGREKKQSEIRCSDQSDCVEHNRRSHRMQERCARFA
jgi:hypothetical protein